MYKQKSRIWHCKCNILLPRATKTKNNAHSQIRAKNSLKGYVKNLVTDDAVITENKKVQIVKVDFMQTQQKAQEKAALPLQ